MMEWIWEASTVPKDTPVMKGLVEANEEKHTEVESTPEKG
jgi:hypothetical protein